MKKVEYNRKNPQIDLQLAFEKRCRKKKYLDIKFDKYLDRDRS
jgi:hypothetical protein